MKRSDAKKLGRYCEEHDRTFERVPLGVAFVTGCRVCIERDRKAFAALAHAAITEALKP